MGIKNKENFRYHFNLEVSNNRPPCGPGSDPVIVKQLGTIEFINKLLVDYEITSINDCPCGLFENWMHLIDLCEIDYVGYDINDLAIERNRKNNFSFKFVEFDLVNEILPYADLIICRDCFFHLSNAFVLKALDNFKLSGAKYLLATNNEWVNTNVDLTPQELEKEAGFRCINIRKAPFFYGPPLEIHTEDIKKYYKQGNNRQMVLWKL